MLQKSDLSYFDYELLQYIADNSPVLESDIIEHFAEQSALSLRLSLLSTSLKKSAGSFSYPVENTSYISYQYEEFTDQYGLTRTKKTSYIQIEPLGKKVLEEYHHKLKMSHRKKWEDRFWKLGPIIISIIALIIAGSSLYISYLTYVSGL